MKHRFVLIALSMLSVISSSGCVSAQSGPPLPKQQAITFHFVDTTAFSALEDYRDAHPGYEPAQNSDGTYQVPAGYAPAGTVVMASWRMDTTGEKPAHYVVVDREPGLAGFGIQEAAVAQNAENIAIMFVIGDFVDQNGRARSGDELFYTFTRDNVGKVVAIVFENKILAAATIQEPIRDGRVQVTGGFDLAEAQRIVALLTVGRK